MQGRRIELTFGSPRFRCAERAILVTHERSRIPLETILERLHRVQPTRYVTVFVSLPWQDKGNPQITNGSEDAHENFYLLFQQLQFLDEHVLILEDDHLFWHMLPLEVASIDRFVTTKDPDVYVLGHSSEFADVSQFPHIRTSATSGLHAQFVHTRVLQDWCQRGYHIYLQNKNATMDNCDNEYAIVHGGTRSVFSFWRPVATQTFPLEQSNRNMWDSNCTSFERRAMRILMVDKYHTGWLFIYVHNWLRKLMKRFG